MWYSSFAPLARIHKAAAAFYDAAATLMETTEGLDEVPHTEAKQKVVAGKYAAAKDLYIAMKSFYELPNRYEAHDKYTPTHQEQIAIFEQLLKATGCVSLYYNPRQIL